MNCKIIRVEIIPVQIALSETFIISNRLLHKASITVVKIHCNNGLYGIGECCPFRTIHTETQTGSVAAGQTIAKYILGNDPTKIRKILKTIDSYFTGHASIKGAFDMALYDLNAKIVEQPLFKYLNGDDQKDIRTNMTVSLLSVENMVSKAKEYQEKGFPSLKLKLGDHSSKKDVIRVREIRKAVGDDMLLSIDANQGWSYIEARRALNEMECLNISHCEAPIFGGNHIHLRRLRDETSIPIMGDESVFSPEDAFQTLAGGCIDLINIKLGKSGGICQAMKIASIAEAFGVDCQVGCFSETRLGISALVHFASAWDNIIYFDLDAPLMHSEDPIIGGSSYGPDWKLSFPQSPGIGADYDSSFLSRFDTITIQP